MPITFDCPSCGQSIRVKDSAAGRSGTCPKCKSRLRVPGQAPSHVSAAHHAADAPTPHALAEPDEDMESLAEVEADDVQETVERSKQRAALQKKRPFGLFSRKRWSSQLFVCVNCGSVGHLRWFDRSSVMTHVILWLLFGLPGLGVCALAVGSFIFSWSRNVANAAGESSPPQMTVFQEMDLSLLAIAGLVYAMPGILYEIANMTTMYRGCPSCMAPNMVPCDTPRGKRLMKEVNSEIN